MSMLPEVFLLSMTCMVLLLPLFSNFFKKQVNTFISLSIMITIILLAWLPNQEIVIFSSQIIVDPFSQYLKIIVLGMFVLIRGYVPDQLVNRSDKLNKFTKLITIEYQVFMLFSVLGLMCLASANSLLMLYLGLELFTLPIYVLIALNKDSILSIEAAIKYFIMGSLASALLLYGFSLLQGISGSMLISDIGSNVGGVIHPAGYVFSLVFILIGIAFKFGAVPFHRWVPDVYEGALTQVTLYIASTSTLAALALSYRLLFHVFAKFNVYFEPLFLLIAILSLIVGSIVAIAQINMKRLLAYGSISHVGFIFLAILSHAPFAFILYSLVYSFLALGMFGVLLLSATEIADLNDFKGLAHTNPGLAFVILVLLLSFIGIPPTIGFYAKWMVISQLMIKHVWVAIIAVIFSVISAFYYLRMIKIMYFDKNNNRSVIILPIGSRFALCFHSSITCGLALFPAPLFALIDLILA